MSDAKPRLVSSEKRDDDSDVSLRPLTLADFTGQEAARKNLRVFIEAAKELGVAFRVVVLGVAYGDQWTNLIQPFWTLPLLAIVGLDARAIMGYCFVVFAMGFVLLGGGLLLIGAG